MGEFNFAASLLAELKAEEEEEDDFTYALEISKEPTALVQVDEDEDEDDGKDGASRPLIRYRDEGEVEMEVPLRLRRMIEAQGKAKQKVQHKPYFTIFISVLDVICMIVELIVNKGFTSLKTNPWLGVSLQTLDMLGGKDAPLIVFHNQWWRVITPVFFHVGIGHLLLNLIAQVLLGLQLERPLGWVRVAIIYFVSAVCGNLMSAVFLPLQLEVGASTAIYGMGSYYFVDLMVHWSLIISPGRYLAGLLIGTVIGLAFGMLPGIDNFAHIGGIIGGFIVSMLVVPRTKEGKSLRYAHAALIIGPPLLVTYLVLCVVFLCVPSLRQLVWGCHWCEYLNCVPLFHWCD